MKIILYKTAKRAFFEREVRNFLYPYAIRGSNEAIVSSSIQRFPFQVDGFLD